jgi:hypothetical protein
MLPISAVVELMIWYPTSWTKNASPIGYRVTSYAPRQHDDVLVTKLVRDIDPAWLMRYGAESSSDNFRYASKCFTEHHMSTR